METDVTVLEQRVAQVIDAKCRLKNSYQMFNYIESIIEATPDSSNRAALIEDLLFGLSDDELDFLMHIQNLDSIL